MTRIKHFISLLLILALAWLSFKSLLPSEVTPADAPLTEFSTARAMEQLKVIADKPHYVGSEAHEDVRNYIMGEMRKMGLEPQIQEGFVQNQWFGYSNLVKAKNIVARYQGTDNTKALLLMSHYDSAPHSKSHGASDAGSGVVAVLESFRAYMASGVPPKNDIIVLFTDSEELGLDGASFFVNEHPWAKDVGVALNFEARGSSGPSNMIVETNGGNANLIKEFKKASPEYPVATSLMYSIYKMLPNDTDSTVLREDGDIDGFFFAFIDDHFNYHTVNDTWQNLNPETLEHQGSYLMPLIKHFSQIDLSKLKAAEDHVYFDMAVFNFVHYPFTWVWPMAILAAIALIFLIVLGVRKKRLYMKEIGKGFLAFILSIVGALFILQLFGWLWPLIYPQYDDMLPVFIYNGHWYTAAFAVLAVAFSFGIYSHFTETKHAASTMVAPLFIWVLINIIIALKLQGGAFFVIPLFFGLLAFWMMIRQQKPSVLLMVLLCAPALLIFTPLLQFFPVGLGPEAYWITILFTVLLFGLLLPVFAYYRQKRFVGYIGLLVTFIFLGIAHSKSGYTSERQKPNSLVYFENADEGKAFWVTYDENLDPWVSGYLGENPTPAKDYVSSASGSKYNAPYTYAKETPVIDLPTSTITAKRDTIIDGVREVTLLISPERTIHRLRLYADESIPFRSLSYNGKLLKQDSTATSYKTRRSRALISYYVSDRDSLELSYSIVQGVPASFTLKEYSFDLLEHPKFTIPSRPDYTMPKPFVPNDAIIIERTIDVDAFAKLPTDRSETKTTTDTLTSTNLE
jgi:hypothetical protein